ncbi:MAG: recombinase family protein [PVC group bacterium]|nr:recombinase family protein [PVC group bacterium]
MNVAIYCRVSTRDQNPENQVIKLKDFAERNDYAYDIFEERESSRKTRPIKNELLQRLRNREYDSVLVWKLDRWARSIRELINEVMELHDKGINFISIQDNIDLSSANGKLQFHILSAFADFERNIISDRTLLGLERAKAEGKQLGRPKGSKDTKRRRRSGYNLRYATK